MIGASHEATSRQYRLLSVGGMRSTRSVVVVGHGMVGHRFVEALRSRDADGAWRVTVLAEEADAAYDRVGLTGYTDHWDRSLLALAGQRLPGRRSGRSAVEYAGHRGRPGREGGADRRR